MNRKSRQKTSLSLKELIRSVQEELAESQAEREEQGVPPLFEVEKLVLEVNFVVKRSAKAQGGVEFNVLTLGGVNIGGDTDYEQQQIHKITLSLKVSPQALIIPSTGIRPAPPRD